MGKRILHLVRHGQYSRDPEQLTALGLAQAECLAARLAEEPIATIHTSVLPRAQQTSEVLKRVLPKVSLRKSKLLVEGIPCTPRWKDVPERLAGQLAARPLEEWAKEVERVEESFRTFVRATREQERVEVLVFHGNWIRALACRALDLPLGAWWDLDIQHCSITTIEVRPNRIVLVRFNETGHLPKQMRTYE